MIEQPIKQVFGSPGGKTYLASRIVGMIPPHETYVEPFAGGAAVYFKKAPSGKEVLSDKDKDIAFALKFLRNMTPEQFRRLKRYDWRISGKTFNRLKASQPKDDVERFRRFYYLKKGSYGYGSKEPNLAASGDNISIDHLPKAHDRLSKTAVHGRDAIAIIKKYDSPSTFFYLDPPYPGRTFIGSRNEDKYTNEDLARLIDQLRHIKGKFALSLGTEHANLLPKDWLIKRVGVRRRLSIKYFGERPLQYEIIATNYRPATKGQIFRPILATRKRVVVRRKAQSRRKNHHPVVPSLVGIRI